MNKIIDRRQALTLLGMGLAAGEFSVDMLAAMHILAIDTALEACSVGVQMDGGSELLRSEVIARSYGCAHVITNDPWFEKLSSHAQFRDLLNAATENEVRSRAEFRRAGGERLLKGMDDSNDHGRYRPK